ncbi:hypothetical protein [Inquilinus limosus]|uniref:Uncharacterized protein n=1 Tax=Inquilinus limosus TaxID=171674 RepID=A0A211ZTP5_9PROT|nr:hypothetical protein [Inquilinus limosus]OWJ68546.1 hypothetical protein BWR60_03815 [Inquilinus limosus]
MIKKYGSVVVAAGLLSLAAPTHAVATPDQITDDPSLAARLSDSTIDLRYQFGILTIYLRPDGTSLVGLLWGGRPPEVMGLDRWLLQKGAICFPDIEKGVPSSWGCPRITIEGKDSVTLTFDDGDSVSGQIQPGNPHGLKMGQDAIAGLAGQTIVVGERDTTRFLRLYLSPDGVALANVADFAATERDVRSGTWSVRDDQLCLDGFGEARSMSDGCFPVVTMQDGAVFLGGTIGMTGLVWPGNSEGL